MAGDLDEAGVARVLNTSAFLNGQRAEAAGGRNYTCGQEPHTSSPPRPCPSTKRFSLPAAQSSRRLEPLPARPRCSIDYTAGKTVRLQTGCGTRAVPGWRGFDENCRGHGRIRAYSLLNSTMARCTKLRTSWDTTCRAAVSRAGVKIRLVSKLDRMVIGTSSRIMALA